MTDKKLIDVKILEEYYEAIEKTIAESDQFQTVSDYVNFVLKEMLFNDVGSGYSKEEEELIKKRFEDLGYI